MVDRDVALGAVSTPTIRSRILKVRLGLYIIALTLCFDPNDPFEDTERDTIVLLGDNGLGCFNPNDPFEDTERADGVQRC